MLLLLAAACSTATDPDTAPAACVPGEIVVTPAVLDFGAVYVGESAAEVVHLDVTGDCPWDYAVTVDPGDPTLALTPGSNGTVEPDPPVDLDLTWTPTAPGPLEATLTVTGETGAATVTLSGEAAFAPSLTVSPSPVDIPDVLAGCADTVALSLTAGAGGATITALTLDADAGFTLDLDEATHGSLPWTLTADETRTVGLSFAADAVGAAGIGTLTIDSDDPAAPTQNVELSASSVAPEAVSVSRTWDRPVDVLVALDTTASMHDSSRLDAIDAAWPDLVDALLASGRDYHLALVANADGCVVGSRPWVSSANSAEAQVAQLREMVAGAGDSGDTLFDAVLAATDPAAVGAGGCNDGLVRAGATLAVLGITDGLDASNNGWVDFVHTLGTRVSDGASVRVAALGGDWPSGCEDVAAAEGWYEATMSVGAGAFFSVCADFATTFPDAAAVLPEPTDTAFVLEDPALAGTITVDIDGAPTADWTYDDATATVALTVSPASGAVVTVSYLPDECTE